LTCCLRVTQRQVPFDPVDVHLLATGGARRRLAARHVLRVLQVHRLVAGLELVALEDVGTRADVLLDLLERVGLGDALGHDEGHVGRRLAQRLEHEAVGLTQEDAEGVGRG
jgi:hypothetical protein